MIKRFVLTLLFLPIAFLLLDPAETLLSRMLRLEQPVAHEIQKGEYLSKLAKEYYGDASYWRELALVNRAPDADYVQPGERILVPGFESIQRIRRARTISEVNRAVMRVQARLEGTFVPEVEPGTSAKENASASDEAPTPAESSEDEAAAAPMAVTPVPQAKPVVEPQGSGGWRWAIFGPALGILVVGGAVIWRRRRRNTFPDIPEFRPGKSEAGHRDLDLEPLSDRISGSDFEGEKVRSEKNAEVLS